MTCRPITIPPEASVRRWAVPLVVALMLLAASPGSGRVATTAMSTRDVRYPSDVRVSWVCRTLPRERVDVFLGDRWVDVLRFNRIDRRHAVAGVSLKVPRRLRDISAFTPMPTTYPDAAGEAKFVLIDLSEQFLGAYEHGQLVFSSPLSAGDVEHPTPTGDFTISAAHRDHSSSLYTTQDTDVRYPMTWALRFHISRDGVSFWCMDETFPAIPARTAASVSMTSGCSSPITPPRCVPCSMTPGASTNGPQGPARMTRSCGASPGPGFASRATDER